jgi:hypothetical protein
MCKKQSILALENEGRFVAQCEHHTVHVAWDNLTIRFRPADFYHFADIVRHAHDRMKESAEPDYRFRLTIHGVGLSFSRQDLVLLRELTCLAVVQMGGPDTMDKANWLDIKLVESPGWSGDLAFYSSN